MKCPYCGAETNNSVCEYCGSVMPDRPGANITCRRCGSHEITFHRETAETYYDGRVRRILYRTVAVCGDCGSTRIVQQDTPVRTVFDNGTESQKSKMTWLWVLGWLYCFPVTLIVWLLRKKTLDRRLRFGLVAVVCLAILGMVLL